MNKYLLISKKIIFTPFIIVNINCMSMFDDCKKTIKKKINTLIPQDMKQNLDKYLFPIHAMTEYKLKLKSEEEIFVRDIIDELNMSQDITVLRADNSNAKNAIAADLFANQYLLVGPKVFKMSDEEKRFIIGRELINLQYNHKLSTLAIYHSYDLNAIILNAFMYCLIADRDAYLLTIPSYKNLHRYCKNLFLFTVTYVVSNLCLSSIFRHIKNNHELIADKEVIKKLNCLEGAKSYISKLDLDTKPTNILNDPSEQISFKIIKGLLFDNDKDKLISMQPTKEKRLEQLKRIAKEASL